MFNATDTIAALATPVGESGIAVIRISGPQALDVLSRVMRQPSGRPFEAWEHRRLYHGYFVETSEARVDEVMASVMRGPDSYTGEDVVEISCHGGLAVVQRVLEVLFGQVRPAEAGEFTRRAFLNGKIDLIQAEAVADLIHARTEVQRVAAERQLSGELSRRIDALADDMLVLLGDLEARIDFIEEGIEALDPPRALGRIEAQRGALDELLASAPMARVLRDGFRVVIAGPVNAGKSSLFNRLLGESRAIVTEIPGTTRDVLRETLVIDGVPFVLHDTAGLRQHTTDRVEQLGMGRTTDAVGQADLVLFVIDGSEKFPAATSPQQSLGGLDATRSIVLINKADLPARTNGGVAGLHVSALTGAGLDELRATMVARTGALDLARMARERSVLNARLVRLLEDERQKLTELAEMLRHSEPMELVAEKAREALSLYEEATGRRYHDGLLDVIFSRFCIGK
ncbi:MAG TPA: tRNA uridine-5-carboxymethylaminomethyl(34) synthesis GTPase MnmE [Candidatus Krumholzibacteria bacterium]|nr:tRNA uridine-5-carboxymethylaminomethyl(34) synthesis GTPase MnmE [Candidatus Krumholzibacteria bacterium]